MFTRIKNNWKIIKSKYVSIAGTLFSVVTLLLSFLSWEDLGIENGYIRILILLLLMILCAASAIVYCLNKNVKSIFGDNNKGVKVCYNDLINLSFPETNEGDRIIVIPVNRCFDVSFEQNLVAENSIHGKWLKRYIVSEDQRDYMNKEIQTKLKEKGYDYDELNREDKKAGNLIRYQPGTVVEMPGTNGVKFYLLAVAMFDKNLNARCTEEEFYKTIQGLVEYYDINGLSKDIYIPVMGDHIIRPTRETKDIIDLMVSMFKFNKQNIHGKVHIVVYSEMKNIISILDY